MFTCKIEIKIVPKLKVYCENQHCLVCCKHSVNGSYHNCELIAMLKTYAVLNKHWSSMLSGSMPEKFCESPDIHRFLKLSIKKKNQKLLSRNKWEIKSKVVYNATVMNVQHDYERKYKT